MLVNYIFILVPLAVLAGSFLILRTDKHWDTIVAFTGAAMITLGIVVPRLFPGLIMASAIDSDLNATDSMAAVDGVTEMAEHAFVFLLLYVVGIVAYGIGFLFYAIRKSRSQGAA